MPLTTRKKTFKKAGASIEEELFETRYGKKIGKFKPEDLKKLFMLINGRAARIEAMDYAIKNNIPLDMYVKRLKREKSKLL